MNKLSLGYTELISFSILLFLLKVFMAKIPPNRPYVSVKLCSNGEVWSGGDDSRFFISKFRNI